MEYTTFLKQFKESYGLGIGFPSTFRSHMGGRLPNDKFVDLPTPEDPIPYITNIPMEEEDPELNNEKLTKEQQEDEEEAPPEEAPPEEAPPEGVVPGMEPGMDPAMGGIPGMEDPKEQKLSANQIGRVYELKKIYTRLLSLESYLLRFSDDDVIIKLRKSVGESINLYEVVISNFEQYKDDIDNIIIQFYKFLDTSYEALNIHFKKLQNKEKKRDN